MSLFVAVLGAFLSGLAIGIPGDQLLLAFCGGSLMGIGAGMTWLRRYV